MHSIRTFGQVTRFFTKQVHHFFTSRSFTFWEFMTNAIIGNIIIHNTTK